MSGRSNMSVESKDYIPKKGAALSPQEFIKKSKVASQVLLLLWKRSRELQKQPGELVKLLIAPCFVFALLVLIYESFNKPAPILILLAGGFIEPYVIPIAFWVIVVKTVIYVMNEKALKLNEAMRMMGMIDVSYWIALFISEGLLYGLVVSLLCNLFTFYNPCPSGFDALCSPNDTLFRAASWGSVYSLYFCYCLAAVPFSFFLCSFFDTAQTASIFTIGLLLGMYVAFCAGLIQSTDSSVLSWCCLLPPMALQVGALTLSASTSQQSQHIYPSIHRVNGILVADIIIYSLAAWYFSQVWPNKNGASKAWNFCFKRTFWIPVGTTSTVETSNPVTMADVEECSNDPLVPIESVNQSLTGHPSVVLKNLTKKFSSATVVDALSLEMYENQITALLGHNGAGKTTTINMLIGSISATSGDAHVYNSSLNDMAAVRSSLGVCPQHDVLFENLTVAEHIIFFSMLKGFTHQAALEEASQLTSLFHLSKRRSHTGTELSGGQRRKLSVAIAVCGGSKFIVLDEPTAGMDPLARRELWDLLSHLRQGRTILLTTHYMDECEVLGDRIAIMNLGKLVCAGSCLFLKKQYGAGYRLIFDKGLGWTESSETSLVTYVHKYIPEATIVRDANAMETCIFLLPFASMPKYAALFSQLEIDNAHAPKIALISPSSQSSPPPPPPPKRLAVGDAPPSTHSWSSMGIKNYGISISSLEEVFLKVGGDDSVTPSSSVGAGLGIGSDVKYEFSLIRQIVGIARRRLAYSMHDFTTLPLIALPIGGAIGCAVLYSKAIISNYVLQAFALSAIYMGTYLGVPGLVGEFLVRERESRLRNLLTVCGCDFRAYWIGNFLGDIALLSIPLLTTWISWAAADMKNYISSPSSAAGGFFVFLIFMYELIGFSYLCSHMFTSPKAAAAFMPLLVLGMIILPLIIITLGIYLFVTVLKFTDTIQPAALIGSLMWGIALFSPHGALLVSLMDVAADFGTLITGFPAYEATVTVMLVEGSCFFLLSYFIDSSAVSMLRATLDDSTSIDETQLDEDVARERREALAHCPLAMASQGSFPNQISDAVPLLIARLRKVFPSKSKRPNAKPVVATEDVSISIRPGECFGLLGANGAGKSTTISMCTRHIIPTAGTAFVKGTSVLTDFTKASTNLGVVTQNNSLWDLLSVEDHLFLFCRLRGVSESCVRATVNATIDQLELTPHRTKLASTLSGGMKRKLCVAIALIGDPAVVLLDEPSAGLDPKSRRNLWNVILRTMSHRSVVLTTHSMEETEALCNRIGIMVKGQLHALGTKQHLKNKFGQGYELSIRLRISSLSAEAQTQQLADFLRRHFPAAELLSGNASLVTFRISHAEMSIAKLFQCLFENQDNLGIDDFSISQPTLEQCFIRVVVADQMKTSPEVAGRVSMFANMPVVINEDEDEDEVVATGDPNCCGCLPWHLRYPAYTLLVLFVVMVFVALAGRGSPKTRFAGPVAIIALITSCIFCCCLHCPCCKRKKGLDE